MHGKVITDKKIFKKYKMRKAKRHVKKEYQKENRAIKIR